MLRTKDLALATTLRLAGIEPDRLELRDGREGFWLFTDVQALEVQELYQSGGCRVEPRAYNIELRRTRDQLFEFLRAHGAHPSQVRPRS